MRRALLVLVPLLLTAHPTSAQELGLFVEAHGSYGVPVGDWAQDEDIEPGPGFGAILAYAVLPGSLQLYGGYDRLSFGLPEQEDEMFGTVSGSAVNEGFRGGGRAFFGGSSGASPFVEAGVVYHRVTSTVRGGSFSISAASDRVLGFEGGGGVVVPLPGTQPISVVPVIRYRQHPLEFSALGELAESSTAASVIVQVGGSVAF